MARAKIVSDSDGRFYGIRFDCPGCASSEYGGSCHVLPVKQLPPGYSEESPHVAGKDRWDFNGDYDRPVFDPSVSSKFELPADNNHPAEHFHCHSFVGCNGAAPGQIIYLGDSTHALAGKVVDLPELDGAE